MFNKRSPQKTKQQHKLTLSDIQYFFYFFLFFTSFTGFIHPLALSSSIFFTDQFALLFTTVTVYYFCWCCCCSTLFAWLFSRVMRFIYFHIEDDAEEKENINIHTLVFAFCAHHLSIFVVSTEYCKIGVSKTSTILISKCSVFFSRFSRYIRVFRALFRSSKGQWSVSVWMKRKNREIILLKDFAGLKKTDRAEA